MNKEEAVKQLKQAENYFVAYSKTTNMPYLTCSQETYNDQVWIFSTEEELKEFGKQKAQEQIVLYGMNVPKDQFPRFYATLYAMGINTIVYQSGQESAEIEFTDLVVFDFNRLPQEKRPLINQEMQLSGIYMMQELRRPVKMEEKTNLRELEEEVIANLKKADYLIAVEPVEEDGKKRLNIPYVQNKKGEKFQPIFTDTMELDKFARGKKFNLIRVKFQDLPRYLIAESQGYAVNPLGFNLPLSKEQMSKLVPVQKNEKKD